MSKRPAMTCAGRRNGAEWDLLFTYCFGQAIDNRG